MEEKIIYTRWLAYELRKKGFSIIRVEPNPNKPEFNCWVFAETPKFAQALTELTQNQKER